MSGWMGAIKGISGAMGGKGGKGGGGGLGSLMGGGGKSHQDRIMKFPEANFKTREDKNRAFEAEQWEGKPYS